MRRSSADSGFGLLPDRARMSTRYACPGRKRRESGKMRVRNLTFLSFCVKLLLQILKRKLNYIGKLLGVKA